MKSNDQCSASSKLCPIKLQCIPSGALNTIKSFRQIEKGTTLQSKNYLPNLSLSENLLERLTQLCIQKKDKSGLLFGSGIEKTHFELQYLNLANDFIEEVFTKVFVEQCACVVFTIARKESLKERLEYEIGRCKKGFAQISIVPLNQGLSVLEQVYMSVVRIFLAIRLQDNILKAEKFCFFPNTNITIKPILLERGIKWINSTVLRTLINNKQEQISQSLKNELQRGTFGYLIIDETRIEVTRLDVVMRSDPSILSKPVVGIWVYLKNFKRQSSYQLNKLLWGLATMYIINTNIAKTNAFGKNTGDKKQIDNSFLFCFFSNDSPKPCMYLASLNGNSNRWMITQGEEEILLPNVPIIFNQMRECDVESVWEPTRVNNIEQFDRKQTSYEEQEAQFIPTFKKDEEGNAKTKRNTASNKQEKIKRSRQSRVYSNDTFAKSEADAQSLRQSEFNDKDSEKSYDQKDIQIRQLRKQLELFKQRYQNLEKIMLQNQSMMQQFYPQILMQNAQKQNPMMGFQGMAGFQFPFVNMPGLHPAQQQIPQIYSPIGQFQNSLFASQANFMSTKQSPSNQITQSAVIETSKEKYEQKEEMIETPPFMKKQSSPQIRQQFRSAQSRVQLKRQQQSPQQITNPQLVLKNQPKIQKSLKQIEPYKQKKGEIALEQPKQQDIFHEEDNDNEIQFEELSKREFDLNLSVIPIEKSPRRFEIADYDQHSQLFDYSSLTYSRTSDLNYYRYTNSSEYSHDYQQTEQARLIENMYRTRPK